MIAPLRPLFRGFLQGWGRTNKAPGWRYQMIERFGPALGPPGGAALVSGFPHGFTMTCDLRDEVQRQIYFWGCYEPIESMIFARLVRPGMVVVDAGANVGNYTLLASAATGESGHVYAFEPVPATQARLCAAVADNHLLNVTVNRLALWNEATTLTLGLPSGHDQNAGAYSVGGAARSISAEAQPLDAFLAKAGVARVDIIKMDVEGAEFRALQGMKGTLVRDHPLLLMEVNRDAALAAGSSTSRLDDLLMKELGYRGWRTDVRAVVTSLASIERANVLFYTGELPAGLRDAPTAKQAFRWAWSARASHAGEQP